MGNEVLKEKLFHLVNKMTDNREDNNRTVKEEVTSSFESYPDVSLLHILLSEIYPEENCEMLVYSLIDCGADVNLSIDDYYGSFIQTAIVTGYPESFVEGILSYALAHGLDPNIVCSGEYNNENLFRGPVSSNNTIMHTAIYSKRYVGSISNLYGMLISCGYDIAYRNSSMETAFETYTKYMTNSDLYIKELEEMYQIEKDNREIRENAKLRIETLENTVKTLISLIPLMSNSLGENTDTVEENLDINWRGPSGETLLHVLLDERRENLENCMKLVYALIYSGVDINVSSVDYMGSFIQSAILAEYPDDFIIEIMNEVCKLGFDINMINSKGDTILHTVISYPSDNGEIKVSKMFEALLSLNFDFSIEDSIGDTPFESFKDLRGEDDNFESELKIISEVNDAFYNSSAVIQNKKIEELSAYGQILNNKEYTASPTVGRDEEVNSLIVTLAQKKKSPILVGESGVGKTAIVEELAYRIKMGDVPSFLKNKLILEVNPNSLVAGQRYVGDFEAVIKSLVNSCLKNDSILFIDEIHSIFGTGSSDKSDVDMASIIKPYLERTSLKLIGTTTSNEYERYFSGTAMKRRFHPINVKELSDDLLLFVTDKVIRDYGEEYGIGCDKLLETNITNTLVEITAKEHRSYFDRVNNPDLIVSIVDRAYAYAVSDESEEIEGSHFIKAVQDCDRISSVAKEEATYLIDSEPRKTTCKVIKINFKK